MIHVKKTKTMGRGIFATIAIAKGTIIEISQVIVMPQKEIRRNTVLERYVFDLDDDNCGVALGLGSLFNHSDKRHNVEYAYDADLQIMYFTTTRDVKKGEQLFIDYGYDPKELN